MADRTIREILELSPENRKLYYTAQGIDRVKIDEAEFTDFSAFSYLDEKSYLTSPTRSSDGSIGNLDSYAWFLTPHLKIDFSLLSIESYRTLMRLIQSKNEFVVSCYDIVNNKTVTHNMYFATEQMPKLWSIAKELNGGNRWVEVLGVRDYTIELIGTNTDFEKVEIQYFLNVPSNAIWTGEVQSATPEEVASNITHKVGYLFKNGEESYDATEITFDNKYKFKYWAENADGSGFKYVNGNEYLFKSNANLYAIWEAGAT